MKNIFSFTFITILLQIAVSIVASNKIVTISLSYHQNQAKLQQLQMTNSQLQNSYLGLTSIHTLQKNFQPNTYMSINKLIDITSN